MTLSVNGIQIQNIMMLSEIEALQEQKRGLMQKLLTGGVRTYNIKEDKCLYS